MGCYIPSNQKLAYIYTRLYYFFLSELNAGVVNNHASDKYTTCLSACLVTIGAGGRGQGPVACQD